MLIALNLTRHETLTPGWSEKDLQARIAIGPHQIESSHQGLRIVHGCQVADLTCTPTQDAPSTLESLLLRLKSR
jgi:hypothetical protein